MPPSPERCDRITGESEFSRRVALASTLGNATYLDIAGKTLSTYRSPDLGPCPDYLWDCGNVPGALCELKSQYGHLRTHHGIWT